MTDDPNQRPRPASDDEPEESNASGDVDAADAPDDAGSSNPDDTQDARSGRVRLGGRDANGRPFSLYLVLGLGVAALLVLLAIIYFSSVNNNNPEQPICTTIDPASAQQSVLQGDVKRVVVNYDKGVASATDPSWGPVLSRIDYTNGECGNLPQGIEQRNAITLVLGTIYLYNEITSEPQVEIKLAGSNSLSPALFETPTSAPTDTPVPTPTSSVAAVTSPVVMTPTPTAPAAATPPSPTGTPEPTATVPIVAEPGTPRSGTPVSSGSPAAGASPEVPTATATPTP
ncbi:MAG TPA: hypothetical protein VFQ54_13490 [Thermomicrobiales bacterium]|nr:hypothetical protein [Thermomicrobiales bacterium]